MKLSLASIPRRERVAVYREVIGPHVVGLDIEPVKGAPFLADLTLRQLPGLQVVTGLAGASVNRRTAALAADGNDDFGLAIVDKGAWRIASRGREVDGTQVSACLTSFAEPSMATTPAISSILALQIPRAALAARVANIDDAILRPIPLDSTAMRLLRGYLNVLDEEASLAPAGLRLTVAGHIHDLAALAVGATRDAVAAARSGGVAAARLHAVKTDILAKLAARELTIETVALRHRLSARHLQRLFEADGGTFSGFVLEARLARSRALLADPRNDHLGVAAIAYDCGFGDLSYFNRAFRRRYAATPSDIRAAARLEPS